MNKKILVKAYLASNLGDDMFVLQLVHRYPNVDFLIFSAGVHANVFKKCHNVRIVPPRLFDLDNLFYCFLKIRPITFMLSKIVLAVVHIGGSIFIEPKQWREENYKLPKATRFYLGANFGPYQTERFLKNVEKRLSLALDVCFRDTYSYDKFSHLKNVRHAPDILFGYSNYPEICEGEYLGISVIDLCGREGLAEMEGQYLDFLTENVEAFYQKGIKTKLFVFCEREGDLRAAQKIVSMLEPSRAEICVYDQNVEDFLEAINSCRYIIATRFHAMVIGFALKKRVFPIIYSDKQSNVLSDLNYSGFCWNLLDGVCCPITPEQLFDGMSEGGMDIDNVRLLSQNHFEKLDQYLEKEQHSNG